MRKNKYLRYIFGVAMWVSTIGALAQQYPTRPIRFIAPYVPGGGVDFVSRVIATKLSETIGQQVIVENRPGGGTNIGSELVARAAPDGYTLLVGGVPNTVNQFLFKKLPYHVEKDFAPVTQTTTAPNLLAVHPSLPVRSVKDLIALAKARPGELNYGAGSPGASNHLAAELFNSMAKVSMVRIGYKGGGPAVLGLISGQTQLMFATAASVKPHIDSGRLRAVAVTTASPSVLFPGLPTVAASGLQGYEAQTIYGLFAPAKTSATVVSQLNKEVVSALARPDVKERLARSGAESASSSPEVFGAIVRDDIARWGKVIRDVGIRAE